MLGVLKNVVFLHPQIERLKAVKRGALAQLARALAWHARGHRFDSVMLHERNPADNQRGFLVLQCQSQYSVSRRFALPPL